MPFKNDGIYFWWYWALSLIRIYLEFGLGLSWNFPCFSLLWSIVAIGSPLQKGESLLLNCFLLRSATSPPAPGSIGWGLPTSLSVGRGATWGRTLGEHIPRAALGFLQIGRQVLRKPETSGFSGTHPSSHHFWSCCKGWVVGISCIPAIPSLVYNAPSILILARMSPDSGHISPSQSVTLS